eukprot:COSAG01_NODE_3491_length_6012_cov_3.665201_2_plen_1109_part_00
MSCEHYHKYIQSAIDKIKKVTAGHKLHVARVCAHGLLSRECVPDILAGTSSSIKDDFPSTGSLHRTKSFKHILGLQGHTWTPEESFFRDLLLQFEQFKWGRTCQIVTTTSTSDTGLTKETRTPAGTAPESGAMFKVVVSGGSIKSLIASKQGSTYVVTEAETEWDGESGDDSAVKAAVVVTRRPRERLHHYLPDIAGIDEHQEQVIDILCQIVELQIKLKKIQVLHTGLKMAHFDIEPVEDNKKRVELISWDALIPSDATRNGTARLSPKLAQHMLLVGASSKPDQELETAESEAYHIWSFGHLLYNASTSCGRPLFHNDNFDNFINDEDKSELAYHWEQNKLRRFGAVVWPEARMLLRKCLRSDTMQRYRTLEDVRGDPFFTPKTAEQRVKFKLLKMVCWNARWDADRTMPQILKASGSISNAKICREHLQPWPQLLKHQASALHRAIEDKCADEVKQMFEEGNVHISMTDGTNRVAGLPVQPLHRAAFADDHVQTMEILLEQLAHISLGWSKHDTGTRRVLVYERTQEHDGAPKTIPEHVQAILDCRTTLAYTPLMIACACGHKELQTLLRNNGCTVKLENRLDQTAEHLHNIYKQEEQQQKLTLWRHSHQFWLSRRNLEQYLYYVERMSLLEFLKHGMRIWNAKLVVVHFDLHQMHSLLTDVRSQLPKSQDLALHFTDLNTARYACLGCPGLRASSVGQLGGGLSVSLKLLDDFEWAKGGSFGGEDANFQFAMKVAGRLWGTKWYEVMPLPVPGTEELAEKLIELPAHDFNPQKLDGKELEAALAVDKDGKPVWGSYAKKLQTAFLVRVPSEKKRDKTRILPGRPDVYIIPPSECVDFEKVPESKYYPTQDIEALLIIQVPGDTAAAIKTLDELGQTSDQLDCHKPRVKLTVIPPSIHDENYGVRKISADEHVADVVKKYRRQGDLRKTVLVYTAFVGPAHVTDSVEARHRIIGDRHVTLWSESVARYTAEEMEAGIAAVEELIPHSHTMVFYYTTHDVAKKIIADSAMPAGVQVCEQTPTALGWEPNAGGNFKKNVCKLMGTDIQVQVLIVLQVPTQAMPTKAAIRAGPIEVKPDGLIGGLFSTGIRWFELDGTDTSSVAQTCR